MNTINDSLSVREVRTLKCAAEKQILEVLRSFQAATNVHIGGILFKPARTEKLYEEGVRLHDTVIEEMYITLQVCI